MAVFYRDPRYSEAFYNEVELYMFYGELLKKISLN